jgi:hypothetical protein
MCTAVIGDGDQRLLELAGASVRNEVHTNPGWWLHWLSGGAEAQRIPFVAIWDDEHALMDLLGNIQAGETFKNWEFYLH